MDQAIAEFSKRLKPDGMALVYYAGHGAQVKDMNYLIPIDFNFNTIGPTLDKQSKETLLSRGSVSLNILMDHLERAKSAFNVVILDACRNDPLEVKSRSLRRSRSVGDDVPAGLARIEAPKGTFIAYSTQPGNTAEDGDETARNSPFAAGLISALKVPNLNIESVMKSTRSYVDQATSHRQLPWDNSSLTGDFYFSVSNPTAVAASQKVEPVKSAALPISQPVATRSLQQKAVPADELQKQPIAGVVPTTAPVLLGTNTAQEKGPKEFCADRPNFISRGQCEMRQCRQPQWKNDPFCDQYNRKNDL